MGTQPIKIGKALRAKLEKPYWVRFWGQRRLCKPVFIERILGDGGKLLFVTPLATRPHHYLIRVDSTWKDNNYEQPCVADHIDEIYDAIENQVGPSEWTDDRGRERHDYWPAASFDCGSCWGDASDSVGAAERGEKR